MAAREAVGLIVSGHAAWLPRLKDHLPQRGDRRFRSQALDGKVWQRSCHITLSDSEDNTVEVYLDTPWYIPQPHGDPLDLDRPDDEIWAQTEAACRADPGFEPVQDWAARFAAQTRAAS